MTSENQSTTYIERANNFWEQFKDNNDFLQGSPKAMSVLDTIVKLNPNNCDAWRELSVAYLKRGLPWKWKPFMDRAVDCDPATWTPHRGYLYLWFYRDYEKAIADFNASDSLTPNFVDYPQGHSVHYWRGIAYLGQGNFKKSVEFFEEHIEHEMQEFSNEEFIEPLTFLYLGMAQCELNLLQEAETNFLKVLQINNNRFADAHFYLAKIYFLQNKPNQALEHINMAMNNFNQSYYNSRNYVETMNQLYVQDILHLKENIENSIN